MILINQNQIPSPKSVRRAFQSCYFRSFDIELDQDPISIRQLQPVNQSINIRSFNRFEGWVPDEIFRRAGDPGRGMSALCDK